MSFIEKTLSDNEEIIKIFHINWMNFIPIWMSFIFGTIFIVASFSLQNIIPFIPLKDIVNYTPIIQYALWGIGGFILLKAFIAHLTMKNIEMGVTNSRLIFKEGIISVHNEEIQINAIETVEVSQSILQRITDSGDVKITGRGDSVVIFKNVDEPTEIKKTIGSVINSRP